jgi:uncharacterized membrane protein YhaH (DUF805 family)
VRFTFLVGTVLDSFDTSLGLTYGAYDQSGILGSLFNLTVLVPSLAVGARRLQDTGRSGWWQLLILTGIGIILLFI